MRRPGIRRLQALTLALALVLGGFGLPLLDALYFHSAAAAATASSETTLAQNDGGVAHLFGCAALTTAVRGSGLLALGSQPVGAAPLVREPQLPFTDAFVSHTELATSQPRAPPVA